MKISHRKSAERNFVVKQARDVEALILQASLLEHSANILCLRLVRALSRFSMIDLNS
jgi:hypothetical protein